MKKGKGTNNSPRFETSRRPSLETRAETFYYLKQMDARTKMIFVLQDNEEIRGVIEWYDRRALKIIRDSEPNIVLLRHNIKYIFKAAELE